VIKQPLTEIKAEGEGTRQKKDVPPEALLGEIVNISKKGGRSV